MIQTRQDSSRRPITGIDHIGVAGRNLRALETAYRRLGFNVTEPMPLTRPGPGGEQIPLGQDSQHFVFRNSYVELTAITDSDANNHLEPFVERYEGLHIVALATASAQDAADELRHRSIEIAEIQDAAREVVYGQPGVARFRWFMVPQTAAPEGLVCVVEHRTPELIFQEDVMDHPNGAVALTGMTMVTADAAATCAAYEELLSTPALPAGPGPVFDVGESRLHIVDARGLAERYPGTAPPMVPCCAGFAIGVVDIDHARTYLQNAGVAFQAAGPDGIWVEPGEAGGAIVEFHPVD